MSAGLDACPTGCGRSADLFAYVMCARCWRKVPKPLQRAVYRAWDARQDNPHNPDLVNAHEAAKAAAIRAVS